MRQGNGAVARMTPKRGRFCSLCGYGIVSRVQPARCPLCGGAPEWVEPVGWASRPAALQRRLAG